MTYEEVVERLEYLKGFVNPPYSAAIDIALMSLASGTAEWQATECGWRYSNCFEEYDHQWQCCPSCGSKMNNTKMYTAETVERGEPANDETIGV